MKKTLNIITPKGFKLNNKTDYGKLSLEAAKKIK